MNFLKRSTHVVKLYPKTNGYGFSDKYFHTKTMQNRDWLLYCATTNSLFCSLWDSSASSLSWKNYRNAQSGFNGFKNQYLRIMSHEETAAHFRSVLKWREYSTLLEKSRLLDSSLQKEMDAEISFWIDVLTSILDAVLFLAKNKLPFVGSSKDINSSNCGNFLALIKYTAKYNPVLALHIARLKKGSVSYLSPYIQNEFITNAGESLRKSIYEEQRKFYAIMFDATPDVSKKEQVSQIIRTVHSDSNDTIIEKSFIDFIHYEGKTGLEIYDMISKKLEDDGLNILECRAQVYDNASSMSGLYQGVQARIKEVNPLAEYIPCIPHSLNLVGQNSMQKVLVAVLLLGQVQNIYLFFSTSTSRWNLLKKYVTRTPKNQNATRWSSKSDAVHVLLDQFSGSNFVSPIYD